MGNKQKMLFLPVILIAMMFFSGLDLFGDLPNVYDNASLFSQPELEALDKKAADLSEKLNIDFIILTISDNQDKTVENYAQDFYSQNGLGYGADKVALLLLFDMDSEQLYVSPFSDDETDYSNQTAKYTYDELIANYGSDDFQYAAAIIYLDTIESYFNENMQIDNSTVSEKDTGARGSIIGYLVGAMVFGGMIVSFMVPKMNHSYTNGVSSTSLEVGNYLENNALNIVDKQDRHINTQLVCKEI